MCVITFEILLYANPLRERLLTFKRRYRTIIADSPIGEFR